jgi:hypothetical protein
MNKHSSLYIAFAIKRKNLTNLPSNTNYSVYYIHSLHVKQLLSELECLSNWMIKQMTYLENHVTRY